MRTKIYGDGIRVRAIAGTYTVLFAFDADKQSRKNLLGFAINRRNPGYETGRWLKGLKVFPSVVPNPPPSQRYDTRIHPIQSFLWGDYTAQPGKEYEYIVRPLYGTPDELTYGDDIKFKVKTEKEEAGPGDAHGVWFNRGAIASQFYAETFKNAKPPEDYDPVNKQTKWLSRGLLEACLKFINDTPKGEALRVAAYEFSYPPLLEALKEAIDRGVDVMIVYEAGKKSGRPDAEETDATKTAKKAIAAAKLPKANLIKRTKRKKIPHNKFIVRISKAGKPLSVWTGSTNFTPSGFLGQTNVGHWINDPDVAEQFLIYWDLLAENPPAEKLIPALEELTPEPKDVLGASSITCLFSPRKTRNMLDWYAARITDAESAVMFTGGFGVSEYLAPAFAENKNALRFIMLEKPATKKTQELLGDDRGMIVVYGNVLGENYVAGKNGELTSRREIPGFELTQWFYKEELFRKFGNIFFVHTKILLIDPLSDEPMVFTGSANFSDDSLRNNDENMVLIRGNTRVADIYLTEYDRILRHFYFRDIAAEQIESDGPNPAKFLKEKAEDWVGPYFKGGFKDKRRQLFFPG